MYRAANFYGASSSLACTILCAEVPRSMGHMVLLLVTGEPVQGQPQASPVMAAPLVLVQHPHQHCRLLLEPFLQV